MEDLAAAFSPLRTSLAQRGMYSVSFDTKTVPDAGCAAEPNFKYNKENQDAYVYQDPVDRHPEFGAFILLDGHGGMEAVERVVELLPEHLSNELSAAHFEFSRSGATAPQALYHEIVLALRRSFLLTDCSLSVAGVGKQCGCTAVVALIHRSPARQTHLYLANVGDSRAVLSRDGRPIRLSFDHVATDHSEVRRVLQTGRGFIRDGRLQGVIALTRALGDLDLKYVLIAEPYITRTEVIESDEFIVLGSDGLWDVVSDADAVSLVRSFRDMGASAEQASHRLVHEATTRGSEDNITVMVIYLRPAPPVSQ